MKTKWRPSPVLNWEKPTEAEPIFNNPNLIARTDVGTVGVFLDAMDNEITTEIIFWDMNLNNFSSENTEQWPTVDAVFSRKHWPTNVFAGEKYAGDKREPDPVVQQCIIDYAMEILTTEELPELNRFIERADGDLEDNDVLEQMLIVDKWTAFIKEMGND